MTRLIAVLDTCVLFPASIRDTVLRAAESDLFQLQLSQQILDELQRSLVAGSIMDEAHAERLIGHMCGAFADSIVTGFESLIPSMTCNAGDRHVAAAAVHAQAQTIVTFNLRDFPLVSLAPYAIFAQHPDTFLLHLFAQSPRAVLQLIEQQALDLRKGPQTTERVLATLEQHAPSFVSRLGAFIAGDSRE